MTIHDPAEKNLKHKTDVLSWDDVPWTRCDLNFRPPSIDGLAMPVGRAFGRLLLAAAIGVTVCLLVCEVVAPFLIEKTSLAEAMVVGLILGLLAITGLYRPLPRSISSKQSSCGAVWGAASVILFFAIANVSQTHEVFTLGIFLLFAAALPANLFIADQMTGHMLHWLTADPIVERNTMVVWRNAWCGRFMTSDVTQLADRGAKHKHLVELQRYWLHHGLAASVFIVGGLASLIGFAVADFACAGVVVVLASTGLLSALAHFVDATSDDSVPTFTRTLGHWFEYSKDSCRPPWVMSSPAGPQLGRSFAAYAGAISLALSFTLLGLVDLSRQQQLTDLQTIPWLTRLLVAGGATLVASLQTLLIAFIVSTRVVSICDETFQIEDEKENPND